MKIIRITICVFSLIFLIISNSQAILFRGLELPLGPSLYFPFFLEREPFQDIENQDIENINFILNQTKYKIVNLKHNPRFPHTFQERYGLKEWNKDLEDVPALKVKELPQNYLKAPSVQNFAKYGRPLTDRKLELIWQEAKKTEIYKIDPDDKFYVFKEKNIIGELPFRLDPFIFLAILGAEGTGSFNTNEGKPYSNEMFYLDVAKAGNLVRKLIKDWIDNGQKGDWLCWVNWGRATPPTLGGYAGDTNWHSNVESMYNGRLQY